MQRDEVSDGVFASVYLTLLGVVQATIVTDLSYLTLTRTLAQSDVTNLHSLLDAISLHLFAPVIFSFVVIVLVTYEYIYFVQSANRFVLLFDVIPLFLLGFSEVVVIHSLDSPIMIWVGMVCLGISGFIAFTNSFFYKWSAIFDDRRIARKFKGFMFLRALASILAAVLSAAILYMLDEQIIDESANGILLLAFAGLFGSFFFLSWPPMHRKMRQSQLSQD